MKEAAREIMKVAKMLKAYPTVHKRISNNLVIWYISMRGARTTLDAVNEFADKLVKFAMKDARGLNKVLREAGAPANLLVDVEGPRVDFDKNELFLLTDKIMSDEQVRILSESGIKTSARTAATKVPKKVIADLTKAMKKLEALAKKNKDDEEMEQAFLQDADDISEIRSYLMHGSVQEAFDLTEALDTSVRDLISKSAYNFMHKHREAKMAAAYDPKYVKKVNDAFMNLYWDLEKVKDNRAYSYPEVEDYLEKVEDIMDDVDKAGDRFMKQHDR